MTRARWTFLAAIGVGLAGALTAHLAADNGGTVWTGGGIVAVVLLFRAFTAYRRARALGARLSWTATIAATVLLGVTVVLGASAVAEVTGPTDVERTAEAVGSCWHTASKDKLEPVRCGSDDAEYKATSEVTNGDTCDEGYINGREGFYLCLTPIPAGS